MTNKINCIHKYEPRYTEKQINEGMMFEATRIDPADFRKLYVARVYVGDVCVKCGKWSVNNA